MPLIKRYPNRKLYDTEAKQYVTLDGIATLIREGEDVQVVDHATGDDLTAVTLTQIIVEQEKKRRGFLPKTVLTGLVQAGGDTMGTLRKTLASSLDLARQVDDEIEERLQALVNRGDLALEDGLSLRDKLQGLGQRPWGEPQLSDQDLERALEQRGVPKREDLGRVLEQLEELTRKLDELGNKPDDS